MPVDFRISDLPTSIPFNNLDIMEVSQVDSESPSGYSSVKKTMEEIGEKLLNDIQYSSALATTNKKIIPAINELLAAIADVADDIPDNGDFSLSGLSDTTITTPSSGQVLSYDGGKWKNNNLLVSKEGVGTLTAVNDTVQIPNDVLAKSIIVIVLRRYGYFGTITVSKNQLQSGAYTAGTQVYGDNNNSWKITISNSGVITLSAISGTAYPNVDCYGLF